MEAVEILNGASRLIADIDRLIDEMIRLWQRAVMLAAPPDSNKAFDSICESEAFGKWAGREDLQGVSSHDWLKQLRAQQWAR